MAQRKKKQIHVDPPQAYIDMWRDPILKLKNFDERMKARKEWANRKRGES